MHFFSLLSSVSCSWLLLLHIFSSFNIIIGSGRKELGDFCHPIEGCLDDSLVCYRSQCICGPGYITTSSGNVTQCQKFHCYVDIECFAGIDQNRACLAGSCSHCSQGFFLDEKVNLCRSRIGQKCTRQEDCVGELNKVTQKDMTLPYCLNGRCICRPNYYPDENYSQCLLGTCSDHPDCDLFGVDPYRFCSPEHKKCFCRYGYIESQNTQICLEFVSANYFGLLLFWVTISVLGFILLLYGMRRVFNRNSDTGSSSMGRRSRSISSIARNLFPNLPPPPPTYDDVLKEQRQQQRNSTNSNNSSNHPRESPPSYTLQTVTSTIQQ